MVRIKTPQPEREYLPTTLWIRLLFHKYKDKQLYQKNECRGEKGNIQIGKGILKNFGITYCQENA